MRGVDPPPGGAYRGAMLTGLAPLAHDARSWPFEQARNLLARVLRLRLEPAATHEAARLFAEDGAAEAIRQFPALAATPVRLETGYGPSGLPHLGTFQEVLRTTMVRTAFRALTDDRIPTELICFSDDMDGLRKAAAQCAEPGDAGRRTWASR